jgi:hypothetical protein
MAHTLSAPIMHKTDSPSGSFTAALQKPFGSVGSKFHRSAYLAGCMKIAFSLKITPNMRFSSSDIIPGKYTQKVEREYLSVT